MNTLHKHILAVPDWFMFTSQAKLVHLISSHYFIVQHVKKYYFIDPSVSPLDFKWNGASRT